MSKLKIVCPCCAHEMEFVSKEARKATKPKEPKPENVGAKELIAAYSLAFKERYKRAPIIAGKEAGIAKLLATKVSVEEGCALVRHFLRMNDPWYIKNVHSFVTFSMNLEQVRQDHLKKNPKTPVAPIILVGEVVDDVA